MKAKFLIPLLVLLFGCNAGNKPLTDAQKEAVKAEATAFTKELFQSLTAIDTVKVLALFNNSPEMSIITPTVNLSYSDLYQMVKQVYPTIEKQTYETKSESYLIIDPTCFVYSWFGKYYLNLKSGETTIEDNYQSTFVVKKEDGVWKVAYGHESFKQLFVADPVKEFTKIENAWNTAILNKDVKTLDLLYAKEYLYTDQSGNVFDRKQDMGEITSGKYKLLAPSVVSDIKVNIYGNIAVVKGLNIVKALSNGKNVSGTFRFTDLFLMRDGRWQCISTESVQLQKK